MGVGSNVHADLPHDAAPNLQWSFAGGGPALLRRGQREGVESKENILGLDRALRPHRGPVVVQVIGVAYVRCGSLVN